MRRHRPEAGAGTLATADPHTTQYAGAGVEARSQLARPCSGPGLWFSDLEPNNTGAHTSHVLLCQVLERNSEWGPRSTASPCPDAR